MFHDLLNALEVTLFMVFTASILTVLLGFPLSVFQAVSNRNNGRGTILARFLNAIIHLISAIPYIVIMIALIPITHWLMDSHRSSIIALIPLTLASIPLFTKICNEAFSKVPKGLQEAAIVLGATPRQLLFKVLIPESLPAIIHGFCELIIQIIGFTVVIGVLGAGGIGGLLVEKGYQNYQTNYVLAIIVTLVALVLIIQSIGQYLAYGHFKKNEQ